MAIPSLADLVIDNRQDGLFRVNRQAFADNDLSRGMRNRAPEVTDELQMRAFWRQWHALMQSPRGSETAVRQPIAV